MEAKFEEHILHFASERNGSEATKTWTCFVVHVPDAADWVDLFTVAQFSHLDPGSWCDNDAYSTAWDEPTPSGWRHPDRPRRLELAARTGLTRFNADIATRAAKFDVVTFINDPLQQWIANLHKMPTYPIYVLTHEAQHFSDDWGNQQLVMDGVAPWEDKHVAATLDAYIREECRGWTNFSKRYLL